MTDAEINQNDNPTAQADAASDRTKPYFLVAWILISLQFGGLMAWSVFAPFEGAVIATGSLVIAGDSKPIQHLDGGLVTEVRVEEGDLVQKGDVLFTFDGNAYFAERDDLLVRLSQLVGVYARLKGESMDAPIQVQSAKGLLANVDLPTSFQSTLAAELAGQADVFNSRGLSLRTDISLLNENIGGLRASKTGLIGRREALDNQLQLITQELEAFASLEADGLVAQPRLFALQRDIERTQGEMNALDSELVVTDKKVAQLQEEISSKRANFRRSAYEELAKTTGEVDLIIPRLTSLKEKIDRLQLRAPQSGRVLSLKHTAPGAVIGSGEAIFVLVPDGGKIIARVEIQPGDIEKVSVDQKARIVFSAFNAQPVPETDAKVLQISADAISRETTGMSYYAVDVGWDDTKLVEALSLKIGMPVDVYIRTESRTAISYLTQPLRDAMRRSWRE